MKYFYKYENWDKATPVNDILIDLDNFDKQGWEVVSHSNSQYRMTVILRKQRSHLENKE